MATTTRTRKPTLRVTLKPSTIETLREAARDLGLLTRQGGMRAGGHRGSIAGLLELVGEQLESGKLVLKDSRTE